MKAAEERGRYPIRTRRSVVIVTAPVRREDGVDLVSSDRQRYDRYVTWSLRHFGWMLLVCALVGAAAPLLAAPTVTTYQADALVVARQLTPNPRVLPALAESIFGDGAVADAVAQDPSLGVEEGGLIPDRLSVVAGPDSITMVVQARDGDPGTAARLANAAAAAFANELNRGGSGVGEFAVQAPAVVPTTPLDQISDPLRAGIGALAGLILGLGLVASVAALYGPCVTAWDVETAVGVPLLGTVDLPRAAPGSYLGPRGIKGIATVTRWLATAPAGRLTLVSAPAAEGMRHRIYVMAAIAMSTVRPLRLEAPSNVVWAVRQQAPRGAMPSSGASEPTDELSLVDGAAPWEILDPAATTVSVVAVAPLGISRRRLRALALDYLNGGLVGVILVRRRLGLRRARGVTGPAVPTRPAFRPAEDVAEPA